MKKLAASIIVAFALCMAAAVAQTGTDPSQATPGSSPSASQPATPSQQQPGASQPDAAAGQPGQTNNNSAAPTEKAEKKLRGCVQSQGGKYVLEAKKGKAIALTGQDVSAHVGHEVSLQGAWESGAGTGVASGGASEKTFNVTGVEMISETCGSKSSKGNSGSTGTSPSSPSGTGSTSAPPQ